MIWTSHEFRTQNTERRMKKLKGAFSILHSAFCIQSSTTRSKSSPQSDQYIPLNATSSNNHDLPCSIGSPRMASEVALTDARSTGTISGNNKSGSSVCLARACEVIAE